MGMIDNVECYTMGNDTQWEIVDNGELQTICNVRQMRNDILWPVTDNGKLYTVRSADNGE